MILKGRSDHVTNLCREQNSNIYSGQGPCLSPQLLFKPCFSSFLGFQQVFLLSLFLGCISLPSATESAFTLFPAPHCVHLTPIYPLDVSFKSLPQGSLPLPLRLVWVLLLPYTFFSSWQSSQLHICVITD